MQIFALKNNFRNYGTCTCTITSDCTLHPSYSGRTRCPTASAKWSELRTTKHLQVWTTPQTGNTTQEQYHLKWRLGIEAHYSKRHTLHWARGHKARPNQQLWATAGPPFHRLHETHWPCLAHIHSGPETALSAGGTCTRLLLPAYHEAGEHTPDTSNTTRTWTPNTHARGSNMHYTTIDYWRV